MASKSQSHGLAGSLRSTRAAFWAASLAAFLLAEAGHAVAANRPSDASLEMARSANSYAIHFETDHRVCGPIAGSLNKEYRIDPDKVDDIPRESITSDAYLSADVQVPWVRKLVEQPDGANFKITSLDVAKATLKGRVVSLFRRTIERPWQEEVGALSVNRVWIANAALPGLPAEGTITSDNALHLVGGRELLVDFDHLQNAGPNRNLALGERNRAPAYPFLLNVVSVNGRLFLLVLEAVVAEVAAPKAVDGFGTVDVFVLEIVSDAKMRRVCWLTSG
jgi:hypothetical protein